MQLENASSLFNQPVAVPHSGPRNEDDRKLDFPGAVAKFARELDRLNTHETFLNDAARWIAETLQFDHFGITRKRNRESLSTQLNGIKSNKSKTISQPNDPDSSTASAAMELGRTVIAPDSKNPSRKDGVLTKCGIASSLVCPVFVSGRTIAALGTYHSTLRTPTAEEILFVEAVVGLVGSTIARIDAENAIEEQATLFSATLDGFAGPVAILSGDGRILRVNQACEQISRATPDELKNRPFSVALVYEEDVAELREAFKLLQDGQASVQARTQCPAGEHPTHEIAWNITAIRTNDGAIQKVIASGVDVTSAKEAEGETVALPEGVNRDRRKKTRREYPYYQTIAPKTGNALPDISDFIEVRCMDISAGGFAFLVPLPPKHKEVVVALGTFPSQIHVLAEIAHVTQCAVDGRNLYRVGCFYTGRAQYSQES